MESVGYGICKKAINDVVKIPLDDRTPSLGLKKIGFAIPELQPDEVLIRVHASALNYNSVWSALSHPLTPFQLISGHVKRNSRDSGHMQDYAIFGSDAAGEILDVGVAVTQWAKGDEVCVHCNVVNPEDPITFRDSMLSTSQSIWGYETNFGAFSAVTKVRASQLLPKPRHLSWEQSASFGLTLPTAYRMLVSPNGANIKRGEVCFIWGAAGGLGSFAIQLCKLVGAKVVAVVGSSEKVSVCEKLGADLVLNRRDFDIKLGVEGDTHRQLMVARAIKKELKKAKFPEIDVVFEHTGGATLMTSVALLKRGGRVTICGASSGYMANLDLRYLWMELKTIIGCHFANQWEVHSAAQLVQSGDVKPVVGSVSPFDALPDAIDQLHKGDVVGKFAITHS